VGLLMLAGPARAWDLGPKAVAQVAQGRPYVEVRTDGAEGMLRGAIDIRASREVVWAVINDCALAPRMAPNLKSCRILKRDPGGHWDVREHISRPAFMPPIRNVFRSDFEPETSVRYRRVEGDLKVFEGGWRLLAAPGGGTRVLYENRIALPFRAPAGLLRLIAGRDMSMALLALRRESLAR
jgi:hypothetical protein